jgi:glucitol operon activator protein
MQVYIIMIFIAGAFVVQLLFGYLQIRHFSNEYSKLRRIGKVAIGKRPGTFQAGTIVFFAVSNSGKILKAKKMQGITVLAKMHDLQGFTGKNIEALEENDVIYCNKLLKSAILDAVNNYKIITNGGAIPGKKSFLAQMNLQVKGIVDCFLKKS